MPSLTGQRTTCHEEKERADTDLKFSSWFSVVVLTACWLVSASQVLVWYETLFRSPPPNLSRNFHLSSHFRDWCSTHVCTSSHSAANLLSNLNRPLLPPGIEGRTISVSGGSTPAQKIWDFRGGVLVILNAVVIHPRLADPQRVGWPESLRSQLALPVDSMSAFSSDYFSSLSPSSEIIFITWTYHITFQLYFHKCMITEW